MKHFAIWITLLCFSMPSLAASLKAELKHVWSGSFTYENGYGYVPGTLMQNDLNVLQDGDILTGITANGLQNFLQPNGYNVDFGGFVLLEFQTPQRASSIYLNIVARPFQGGVNAGSLVMSADQSLGGHYLQDNIGESIMFISGYFNQLGNSFDLARQWQTINDIMLPENCFRILVWGPYVASSHSPGLDGVEVFEATMTYELIPEPCTLLLLGLGGFALRHRKPRSRLGR